MAITIMVSADYFGNALQITKHHNNVSATKLMRLFDCNLKQLHRYENGTDLIPQDILRRIFTYAVQMNESLNKE